MSSPLDFFKRPLIVAILALALGLGVGLVWGWVIQPVTYTNTTPEVMRPDLQEDYLRMAIDSFRVNQDPNLAVQRWKNLGSAASPIFAEIKKNPKALDPPAITPYGQGI